MPTRPRKTTTAAERKRRAAQKPDQPAEVPAAEQPAEAGQIDGVLVARIPLDDDVNYRFQVTPIGDVRATEIGDILAYGLRDHRKRTDPE